MDNNIVLGVRDLEQNESQNIYGGLADPYMRDLGRAFGVMFGVVANAVEWAWSQCTTPAPGDNSALLQTNALTLFN
jgi:hypothetical protein